MAQGSSNPSLDLKKVAGTAVDTNTGNASAGTQRVVLATNQPAVPVNGPLTDTQLRATAVPVSGTVTANAGTGNFTVTQATAGNLNATVTGTVELGPTSLEALENISITVPGTVELGTVSLTALETITVTSGTPADFQSKVYGAVTTAAPAYTDATNNALSLTTSGALRIDGSAVTQPVSGTFWQATQPVSGPLTNTELRAAEVSVSLTSLPTLAAGTNAIGKLAANDGVDIGDVTINNASIAVTGSFWQTTQPVSIADAVAITDNSGSLTVDAPVGTPVFVRLSDGTSAISTLPVSLASVPSHEVTNAGTFAVQVTSAPTTAVTGTFWQATQPVSLVTLPALAAGSASIGTVVLAAESTKVIGTVNVAAAQSIAVTQATAANLNATVSIAANQTVQTAATPQSTAAFSPSNATTSGYANSLVVKASLGTLYCITGYNSKTSSQFIQVHDTTSVPSNEAVPKIIFRVPAESNFSLDLTPYGRYFLNGITVTNSSTSPGLTLGSLDCWFDVQYK